MALDLVPEIIVDSLIGILEESLAWLPLKNWIKSCFGDVRNEFISSSIYSSLFVTYLLI
jgi:hypothetical protein